MLLYSVCLYQHLYLQGYLSKEISVYQPSLQQQQQVTDV